MSDRVPQQGSRALSSGIAMLAIPPGLYLMARMGGSGHEGAGLFASWPAFLLWPMGLALITGDLLRRVIRRIDGGYADHDEGKQG